MSRRGIAGLAEMLVVLVIAAMLFMLIQPSYKKFVERSRLKQGIHQLYNIKKAMEQYMASCRGYPWVGSGVNGGKSPLVDAIDCCSDGSESDVFGTGSLPKIYPEEVECDTTTFQSIVPGFIYDHNKTTRFDACDYNNSKCIRDANNSVGGINKSFVQADAGNPVSPMCASPFGWSFALVPGTTVLVEPTAVYCGAVALNGGFAIIVIDSEGGGRQDPDDLVGTYLANYCDCGAWCYESVTGSQGCCNNCDEAGNFRIPLRY
ncbi:MAG: hypothetical protein ABIH66_04670 [bacterium]